MRRAVALVTVGMALGLAASPAGGVVPVAAWVKEQPAVHPKAFVSLGADMASDGSGVIFYGSEDDAVQTWRWDGANWARLRPKGQPGPRCSGDMAYDSARDRIVYVTNCGVVEWDGSNWLPGPGAADLPALSAAALAYDASRGVTVLFGGRRLADGSLSNETWDYDGIAWRQVNTPTTPLARWSATLVYDELRQKLLLFGGRGAAGDLNDTWVYSGGTWTKLRPLSRPSGRSGHAAAYDPARGRTVLFGGAHGDTRLGDTWEWTGSNWRRMTVSPHPLARAGHALAWDATNQAVLLFGGGRSDTWSYSALP